jgi:flagella basal body P-ring formation protein FlgA
MALNGRKVLLSLATMALAACIGSAVAEAGNEQHMVFVPRHVIYPGDEITSDALVERRILRPEGSAPVFGENPADLVGKVSRRTLLRGQLIPNSALREKNLVIQGHRYRLVYKSDYVSITGTGIPMQSAAAGEMVGVRNPDTGVIVKAMVMPDKTLAVDAQ